MELSASANTVPALLRAGAAALDSNVRRIGGGLLASGFGRGAAAAILSETRPEAVHADLAILGAGGASIAIHPDDPAEQVGHILHTGGCRIIFVEGEEQLDKVLTVRDSCPALSRIVITDMKGLRDFNDPFCESLEAFIAGGDASGWEAAVSAVAPDHPAVILFPADPSASMGRVLSHGDVMGTIIAGRNRLPMQAGDERLAVLRMADVTERIFGLYLALDVGVISNYLESPETATENLQQMQPTVFGADAEAWERLHGRITRAADAATTLQRKLYRWAIGAAASGGAMSWLANLIVLRAVRRELDLNKLRLAYVGDSPIGREVEAWAGALGFTIQRVGGA